MSDVIAKRRIFSEARRKLKHIQAAVHEAAALATRGSTRGSDEAEDRRVKAQRNWLILRQACHAIVSCSKETLAARRAVTAIVENTKEGVSLEERQFHVSKLQALCQALGALPEEDAEEASLPRERTASVCRRELMAEINGVAARLQAPALSQNITEMEEMLSKLQRLRSEFGALDREGSAVAAMEEALDGIRSILQIAKAESEATSETPPLPSVGSKEKTVLSIINEADWADASEETIEHPDKHRADPPAPWSASTCCSTPNLGSAHVGQVLELPAVPEPLEAIDAFPAPDEAPAAPPPLPAAPPAAPPAPEQAPVLAREEPALAAAAILETPSVAVVLGASAKLPPPKALPSLNPRCVEEVGQSRLHLGALISLRTPAKRSIASIRMSQARGRNLEVDLSRLVEEDELWAPQQREARASCARRARRFLETLTRGSSSAMRNPSASQASLQLHRTLGSCTCWPTTAMRSFRASPGAEASKAPDRWRLWELSRSWSMTMRLSSVPSGPGGPPASSGPC
ncbi:unnamed protein product [Effrenium voratum]|nr:unnamed protein product [Effrenium voratum]